MQNRFRNALRMAAVWAALGLTALAGPAAHRADAVNGPQYVVQDLGVAHPEDPQATSIAVDLIDAGLMAGNSWVVFGAPPPEFNPCYRYGGGDFVELDTPTYDAAVTAMNEIGGILGNRFENGRSIPFVTFGGTLQDLEVPANYDRALAVALNEVGDKVGRCGHPQLADRAVRWDIANFANLLPAPAGATASAATDVNQNGLICGYYIALSEATGHYELFPCLWSGDVLQDLPLPAGFIRGSASHVNNGGVVLGTCQHPTTGEHTVVWVNGSPTVIEDGSPNRFVGLEIATDGTLVGWTTGPAGQHAALWRNGAATNLNEVIAPGSGLHLLMAMDINRDGEILAFGGPTGVPWPRSYRLTPETPPAADLSVQASAPASVFAGTPFQLNLSLTAAGGLAESVTAQVDLPAGMVLMSSNGFPEAAKGQPIGEDINVFAMGVQPGQTVSGTLTLVAADPGAFSIPIYAGTTSQDANLSNNAVTVNSTALAGQADVSVSVAGPSTWWELEDFYTCAVTVRNNSDTVAAQNVRLRNVLSALDFDLDECDPGYDEVGGGLEYPLGTLNPGQQVVVNLAVDPSQELTCRLTASVTSAADPQSSNDSAFVDTVIDQDAQPVDMSVSLTGPTTGQVGEGLIYGVRLERPNGDTPAQQTRLRITLAGAGAGFALGQSTPGGQIVQGGLEYTVNWAADDPDNPNDGRKDITVAVGGSQAGPLTVTASIANLNDPNSDNDSDQLDAQIVAGVPDLVCEWQSLTFTQTVKKNKPTVNIAGVVRLRNVGGALVSVKGATVAYYLSNDAVLGSGDIKVATITLRGPTKKAPWTLAAWVGSVTQSWSVSLPKTPLTAVNGKYVIARVDDGNLVAEGQEGNNTASRQIVIPAAP